MLMSREVEAFRHWLRGLQQHLSFLVVSLFPSPSTAEPLPMPHRSKVAHLVDVDVYLE